MIYLLKEDYSKAVTVLKRLEEVAPGWNNVRYFLWLSHKMETRQFDTDTFKTIHKLQNAEEKPQVKVPFLINEYS